MPNQTSVQRWRCPAVKRVKSLAAAAAGVAVALVFFPLWLGIPVAAVFGVYGLGLAAFGASVTVDEEAGLLRLRIGPIVRRIRLVDISAVLVDEFKVSLARTRGAEISMYTWRKGPLDALLRVPIVAGDIGHAISRATALAQAARAGAPQHPAAEAGGPGPLSSGRTPARIRSRLATTLMVVAGALAVAAALFVRVHWHNPALTVLGVIIALGLGFCGLLYLLVAVWILLSGRTATGLFASAPVFRPVVKAEVGGPPGPGVP